MSGESKTRNLCVSLTTPIMGYLSSVLKSVRFCPMSARLVNSSTRESFAHAISSRARVCQERTALRILILSAILGWS